MSLCILLRPVVFPNFCFLLSALPYPLPRYEVDGPLNTPAGRTPYVRTVWQLDHGEVAPRLITAYPVYEAVDD